MTNKSSSESVYVVVIRAGSRLRFMPNEQLQVKVNIGEHWANLTFQTRYCDEGFESPIPRELWIDARGSADSLESALVSFTNAAMFFTTIISFCTNGHAGDCRFHLAYDSTPGRKEREFFEHFVEDERGLPRLSRKIKPHIIQNVINILGGPNPHIPRLRRAIGQYDLALKYWSKGEEILAVAHLFMGMESLVPVMRGVEQARLSLASREALAAHFGIDIKDLDGTIRRELLFSGDIACHRAAKRISDGFEHGFVEPHEVRQLAIATRNKIAGYLRQAIIRLLNLPEEITKELLAKPYDKPIGIESYIRYLKGHLLADHDDLAPDEREYPGIEWKFGVKSFSMGDNGELNLTFSQSMTPRLGKGVSFRPKRVEIYGPEGILATPGNRQKLDPQITRHDTDDGPKSQEELTALLHKALSEGKVKEIRIITKEDNVFVISEGKPLQRE